MKNLPSLPTIFGRKVAPLQDEPVVMNEREAMKDYQKKWSSYLQEVYEIMSEEAKDNKWEIAENRGGYHSDWTHNLLPAKVKLRIVI